MEARIEVSKTDRVPEDYSELPQVRVAIASTWGSRFSRRRHTDLQDTPSLVRMETTIYWWHFLSGETRELAPTYPCSLCA